jgi:hypothetical protein
LKLLLGAQACSRLVEKHGEEDYKRRAGQFAVKHEISSSTGEGMLRKMLEKAEDLERNSENKEFLFAIYYGSAKWWARDIGLSEDVVDEFLVDLGEQVKKFR